MKVLHELPSIMTSLQNELNEKNEMPCLLGFAAFLFDIIATELLTC